MPKVSVVIPTCDRNPIPTLESILNQTYQNFEILVVNDGSKQIWEPIRKLFESRKFNKYVLISHLEEKYRGASAARNDGIKASQGKILAFCDDDDQFYPNHLELLVNYLENHEDIDMVFSKGWAVKTPDCGIITRAEIWVEELPNGSTKGVLPAPYYQVSTVTWDCPAPLPCWVFRKKCFKQVGLFDEGLRALNDFELINRFALAGFKMEHLDVFSVEYTVHGKGINSKDPEKAALTAQAIRRRSRCQAWRRGLVKI